MSYTSDQLLSLTGSFEKITSESLVKTAKKKEDKKNSKGKKPAFWMKNKDMKDSNSAKDSKTDSKSNKADSKSDSKKKKDKKKKSAYYVGLLNKIGHDMEKYGQDTNGEVAQKKERNDSAFWNATTNQWYTPTIEQMKLLGDGTIAKNQNGEYYIKEMDKWHNIPADKIGDYNVIPETTIVGRVPQKNDPKIHGIAFSQDVQDAQKTLNSLIDSGKLQTKTLSTDGKMGNLTREALKAWKAYANMPTVSDDWAISAINNTTN